MAGIFDTGIFDSGIFDQSFKTLSAEGGSYVVTGTDAALTVGNNVTLLAEVGTYVITGTAASFEYGFNLDAGGGSYVISGTAATFARARAVSATGGEYLIVGTNATLSFTGRFDDLVNTYSLGASMTNSRSEANRMTKTISDGFVDLVNTRGTNP